MASCVGWVGGGVRPTLVCGGGDRECLCCVGGEAWGE